MRLVAKVDAQSVERAAAYINTTMGQRAGRAMGNFAGQQAMIGAEAAEVDPGQWRRITMAKRLAGGSPATTAAQQQAMAKRLLAPGIGNPR